LTQEIGKRTPQTHCGSKQKEQWHLKRGEYIRTKSRVLNLHESSFQRAGINTKPSQPPQNERKFSLTKVHVSGGRQITRSIK